MKIIEFNSNCNCNEDLNRITEILLTAKEVGYTHAQDVSPEVFDLLGVMDIDQVISVFMPCDYEGGCYESLDEASKLDLDNDPRMATQVRPFKVHENWKIPNDMTDPYEIELFSLMVPPHFATLYYEEPHIITMIKHNVRKQKVVLSHIYFVN